MSKEKDMARKQFSQILKESSGSIPVAWAMIYLHANPKKPTPQGLLQFINEIRSSNYEQSK